VRGDIELEPPSSRGVCVVVEHAKPF
jgi:hypothetical protein